MVRTISTDSNAPGLDLLGIKYKVNPYLVRGLDYYAHTCFEYTTDKLGSQSALIAGGRFVLCNEASNPYRYDGLAKTLGSPNAIPGMGYIKLKPN